MASTEYAKTYWSPESNRFVHSEDSRAVSHAYLALLFVWRRRGWNTKSLPINFVTHLAMFILYMSGSDPAATVRQRIAAAEAAFTFLWLVFEYRGRIPLSDHVNIRYFILPAVIHLQQIQERISTQREQRELAQMLVEVDFTSLAGRVLLLVSGEGNEFQDTECFDELTGAIYALQDVISESASISPELFIDSKIEWGKAFIQLGMWRVWGKGNLDLDGCCIPHCKNHTPTKEQEIGINITQTVTIWTRYGDYLSDSDTGNPQNCANPRCIDPITQERTLRLRYMCEKCNLVAYCGSHCQRV
ncbi:hypothetical protein FRC12_024885 [Ceratobasidium sp. 428]|nr:hypothetical protein FRC12_024885 [Ceratobasidium sp. 428]